MMDHPAFPGAGMRRMGPGKALIEARKSPDFNPDKSPCGLRAIVTISGRKIVSTSVPKYLDINE